MAQILKDKVKKAIIDSAKQEFSTFGFENASMRNIAAKANVTVGNLYRYFKSKEELNDYILKPTKEKINKSIDKIISNNISIETRVFNVKPSANDLKKTCNLLLDDLIQIKNENEDEFKFLLKYSKLDDKINIWLQDIVLSLISLDFSLDNTDEENIVLTDVYINCLFTGIRDIFCNYDFDDLKLKKILKDYIYSYINLLDNFKKE